VWVEFLRFHFDVAGPDTNWKENQNMSNSIGMEAAISHDGMMFKVNEEKRSKDADRQFQRLQSQ
jgi:hypothetical protein